MVIEEKRNLLSALTKVSSSKEVRDYEQSFLKRYARIMHNRYSFFKSTQKASSQLSDTSFFKKISSLEN